jgi:hypothetical protein
MGWGRRIAGDGRARGCHAPVVEFRLVYQGALKGKGTSLQHKHAIRSALHPQLKDLWAHPPMSDQRWLLSEKLDGPEAAEVSQPFPSVVSRVGAFKFASLVCTSLHLVAELEVVVLKPGGPGSVVRQGGDLDNQLKTLLDALRKPEIHELPPAAAPTEDQDPFHCLLEDDQLVTRVDLSAHRWLDPPTPAHVHVDVVVRIRPSRFDTNNMGFV